MGLIKILHVVHGYAPAVGGTQWMVQNISERLVADYGDEVTVFTTVAYSNAYFRDPRQPAMEPGVEQFNGVTIRRFPVFNRLSWLRLNAARVAHKLRLPGEDWLRGLYFGPIVPGLTRAIAASGADVVMASAFPLLHMYYALWGGERAAIPVVLLGALHPADRWCFDRPTIYQAIRRCAAYVAYTSFERDYLQDRGVSPEHVTVIGAGVNPAVFDNESVRAAGLGIRYRYGWANDDPVVAIVGRQAEHKRIDLALAAMRRVWSFAPAARLLIAGARTDYSSQIDAMLAALPPAERDRVTIVEDFDEADKPIIYNACDLLIHPSERESFGVVFLEAWACGRPVIGARVGAIPTVIDEGRDGLLAAYGDVSAWAQAIERLLARPALRTEMGARGKQKVLDRYTWDVVVRRFREVYLGASQRAKRKVIA